MAYDIFISYRRKGAGAGVAGELQSKLENMGYKVFLDVDEIGSGQFPEQIEKAISECKDFILVLSPGTLDRCVVEEDWVRREILHAQKQNKNILGVGLPGFIMPEAEALPDPLKPMTTIQVFSWTHEYRTASFEKIAENLVSTQVKKKKNRHKLIALVPTALILVVAALMLLPKRDAEAIASVDEPQQEVSNDDLQIVKLQTFDIHVEKARKLTQNLPDAKAFQENIVRMVNDSTLFNQLTKGIAEYDEALKLKKEYPDQIVDTYGVESMREELLKLRKSYFDAIMADFKTLQEEGKNGVKFARQDLKMARIIALSEEKDELNSLDAKLDSLVAIIN